MRQVHLQRAVPEPARLIYFNEEKEKEKRRRVVETARGATQASGRLAGFTGTLQGRSKDDVPGTPGEAAGCLPPFHTNPRAILPYGRLLMTSPPFQERANPRELGTASLWAGGGSLWLIRWHSARLCQAVLGS